MNVLQREYCGEYHDGTYGSGRFCSSKCARKYSNKFVTKEGRERQIEALTNPVNKQKNIEAIVESNIKRGIERRNNINRQIVKNSVNIKKISKQNMFKHPLVQGTIGELAVAHKFGMYGFNAYRPLVDINGCDLLLNGYLL